MKKCKKCGISKPRTEFPKHSSIKGEVENLCKKCRYQQIKLWRKKNKEKYLETARKHVKKYANKYPEKMIAHQKVTAAKLLGILIKPKLCELCGKDHKNIQAHHEDYSKPLEVVWLCVQCHNDVHNGKKTI